MSYLLKDTGSNTTSPKETYDAILQSTTPILLRRRPARHIFIRLRYRRPGKHTPAQKLSVPISAGGNRLTLFTPYVRNSLCLWHFPERKCESIIVRVLSNVCNHGPVLRGCMIMQSTTCHSTHKVNRCRQSTVCVSIDQVPSWESV